MIGKLPKPERDKIALYCFNVRMRNGNKIHDKRANPRNDSRDGIDSTKPATANPDTYTGPLRIHGGIYHPCRVGGRG